jgi:hypothetical protein
MKTESRFIKAWNRNRKRRGRPVPDHNIGTQS